MSIEAQLLEMLRRWELEADDLRWAGVLPLLASDDECAAARARAVADYAWVERQVERFAAAAAARGDFSEVAQLLDVAGQARLNRERLG
jgi:hypothetical protein